MIREAFAHYPYAVAACGVLVLFTTLFTGILFWVSRPEVRRAHRRIERLPLEET